MAGAILLAAPSAAFTETNQIARSLAIIDKYSCIQFITVALNFCNKRYVGGFVRAFCKKKFWNSMKLGKKIALLVFRVKR